MYLALTPNAAGASTLVLVNDGASTGYELLQGATFGSPTWEHTYSGARGTQGARPSQGRLPNRLVTLPIRVTGASKDAMAVSLSNLADVVELMRRSGGTCRMRSKSQTRYQNFEVLTATVEVPEWNNRLEHRNLVVAVVTLTCGPYILGDQMDHFDPFTTDNVNGGVANYTADSGALTNVAVTGGTLDAAANLSTENRLIYTGSGYTLGDVEVTVQATPGATISSFKAGVILKRVDASNYLTVYVDDNGANSRLRIDKVVAGSTTNLATTNLGARVIDGTRFWVRGRIEGNVVTAEYFLSTVLISPTANPTTSTSSPVTGSDATLFGRDAVGRAGISFTPQHTNAFLKDFRVEPYVYRRPATAVIDVAGPIPGDAPAVADVRMAQPSDLSATAAEWAMFAWAGRPSPENRVRNGGFEGNSTTPWIVSAVTGVTGAATSIAAVDDGTLGAGAKFGEYVGQVVCPATANTGASHPIYRQFERGRPYTGRLWVRASSGTTNVRIRLGVSGDIASSTAVALSTGWTEHTVTWTPTIPVDLAYLAVEVTAATATTFQIDGACVYAGATAPSTAQQLEGQGAAPPLVVLQGEEVLSTPANLTRTSNSDAIDDFSFADSSVSAGGETYTVSHMVEPGLVAGDDYGQGEVAVEVWARVMVSAAFTGGVTALASARAETGTSLTYTSEYGAIGKRLVAVSGNSKWRTVRMGTLNLPVDQANPGRWLVTSTFTVASGTNLQAFAVDAIFYVPARSRFLMPTGKAQAGGGTSYPSFLTDSTTLYRTVRSDLSSTIHKAVGAGPAGGVGGALIEFPPGNLSVLSVGASMIPDDPDVVSESEVIGSFSLHLAVTPRWHWLRDA